MKNTAIVLSAGSGHRMGGNVKKQYLSICGHPVVYYPLKVFEESFIDEIILVVSPGDVDFCRENIVEKYGFSKVAQIVEGGAERYHSVYAGVVCAVSRGAGYIYIHDGARAFVTEDILERCRDSVMADMACVAAVPSVDTIKVSDENGFVESTPDRSRLWSIQTPQVFEAALIERCYSELIRNEKDLARRGVRITDDASVCETFSDTKVRLVEGSYENIKLTTPGDLAMGEAILKARGLSPA
ncbi:MAG: 2-C-methyl-D-erythritol 4-phosphate cytidylyltransferase [Lachnospiraceae bacterium]|nr:2-C-methyl-D-erythritol 4-phosphate cytidylyltransferase [Lachnospiraceae bacterium]